ncbi:TetR/AcrR family transcriptional regulator [Sphingomonas hankookensis]|uniref:TetR/AcrR family transcriptional regulator n=1 Tax=Sphingomonas hankookensis TaxID=563996 RepID=UPI001F574AD1|nr:TetR/AcrR family transcriptional regulator [Sphingomonas hankookensis]
MAARTPPERMWQEVTGESNVNLLQCGEACRASRAVARREKLVTVARKLFSEHGFHGTGVAQIAAESGIKVGQIYRDFADKEAIVAEIVENDLRLFLHEAEIAQAVERRNIAAIRDWLRMFMRCGEASEARALMPEILAEAARNDRIKGIAHTINRRVKQALVQALTALAPHADQANARGELAETILTWGAGIMHRRIADPDFDDEAAYRQMSAHVDATIDQMIATAPYPILQKEHCGFVTAT